MVITVQYGLFFVHEQMAALASFSVISINFFIFCNVVSHLAARLQKFVVLFVVHVCVHHIFLKPSVLSILLCTTHIKKFQTYTFSIQRNKLTSRPHLSLFGRNTPSITRVVSLKSHHDVDNNNYQIGRASCRERC